MPIFRRGRHLAPNVIFVSPGSKSKTFQEAPGLATQAPRLPFNAEVVNTIKHISPKWLDRGTNLLTDSDQS
jgi:hypothetical protein